MIAVTESVLAEGNLNDARAAVLDPAFGDLEVDGAKQDRLYIPTRYPNGLPGGLPAKAFGRKDADAAVERASRIVDAVVADSGWPDRRPGSD